MNTTTKKYVFITGGVTSSLGKGLTAASIAFLLERRGFNIGMLKMDPYINVDPGTMSPYQHGEVYVTDDGAETDLDLGHYERLTHLTLSQKNNFTTGQVYLKVIEDEREGRYLGKTVQVVPHITNEIKRRIHVAAQDCDILFGEIGGTVGDIESQPFLEAIRQFSLEVGPENVLFIHLVLVPYLKSAGEQKSKPAQHSLREMRSIGIFPQMVICRAEQPLDPSIVDKIALFGNIKKEHVFQAIDTDFIYRIPFVLQEQKLDEHLLEQLNIQGKTPDFSDLEKVIHAFDYPQGEVHIALVGKYSELIESYKSLDEALRHGALANRLKLKLHYVAGDDLSDQERCREKLGQVHGILVPGGFGARGAEGKMQAIRFARENNIPYFGICYGLQLAVVDFARHKLNLPEATSEELSTAGDLIIHYMDGQSEAKKGGSMRLGAYPCTIKKDTLAHRIYQEDQVDERHRHRLEVNNAYRNKLADAGLVFSGICEDLDLVEMVEIPAHPFFIACQFHPEFKSRPFAPHPLFRSFITAAQEYQGVVK